jgi:hypothetical protein
MRPCVICSDTPKLKLADELIKQGTMTDLAVAERLGMSGNTGRMRVARHRRSHVQKHAQAVLDAVNKGHRAVEHRQEIVKAAEHGDPAAFIALDAIVGDVRKVTDRLERVAGAAEQDNQRVAVASVSGQQLRAAEIRSKLGSVGGYAPPRAAEAFVGVPFNLTINMPNGVTQRIEAMTTTDGPSAPLIDVTPVESIETIPDRLLDLFPDKPSAPKSVSVDARSRPEVDALDFLIGPPDERAVEILPAGSTVDQSAADMRKLARGFGAKG